MLSDDLLTPLHLLLVFAELWHLPALEVKLRALVQQFYCVLLPSRKSALFEDELTALVSVVCSIAGHLFDREFFDPDLGYKQTIAWRLRSLHHLNLRRGLDEIDAYLQVHANVLFVNEILGYDVKHALIVLAVLVHKLFDSIYEFLDVLLFDPWYTV